MPLTEKELNCHLLDMIDLLERIEEATDDKGALKQIAVERKRIERKLYQKLPLMENEN
mgnify:CR=1 FL=1